MKTTVRFDVVKLQEDMAERGWMPTDLARASGVSDMTVSRFLRGETQTPRVAGAFARALGKTIRRYLIRGSREAVA